MDDDDFPPVTVTLRLSLLCQIQDCLRECGEDVIANADAEYPEPDRDKYPTSKRRYERDSEPGRKALALVALINDILDEPFKPTDEAAQA